MKRPVALAALLLVLMSSLAACPRGGGGCIEQGTPILTPSGAVPIERLQSGDIVWSLTSGRMEAVREILALGFEGHTWLDRGVLIFSQFYDSAYALAKYLMRHIEEQIGLYTKNCGSSLFCMG